MQYIWFPDSMFWKEAAVRGSHALHNTRSSNLSEAGTRLFVSSRGAPLPTQCCAPARWWGCGWGRPCWRRCWTPLGSATTVPTLEGKSYQPGFGIISLIKFQTWTLIIIWRNRNVNGLLWEFMDQQSRYMYFVIKRLKLRTWPRLPGRARRRMEGRPRLPDPPCRSCLPFKPDKEWSLSHLDL